MYYHTHVAETGGVKRNEFSCLGKQENPVSSLIQDLSILSFSCSTQRSMNFFLLINVKMPTIVGILTFMSGKNNILGLSEPKKAGILDIFILMSI